MRTAEASVEGDVASPGPAEVDVAEKAFGRSLPAEVAEEAAWFERSWDDWAATAPGDAARAEESRPCPANSGPEETTSRVTNVATIANVNRAEERLVIVAPVRVALRA